MLNWPSTQTELQGGEWNRLDAYALAFHRRVRQDIGNGLASSPPLGRD